MVNRSLIGVFGPEFQMPIEHGKIREFARAIYAEHPEHMTAPEPVMPSTFLTTAGVDWGYTLERPRGTLLEALDHDLSVPLHAEESYRFHGPPPRAGTTLTARAQLESVAHKRGKRGGELAFLVLLTEFRDDRGRLIAEARSTTVTTERVPDEAFWKETPPVYAPDYSGEERERPFEGILPQGFEELEVGASPGTFSPSALTLRDIVRYQGACGEDNPLHYDRAYARAHGYDGFISIGMQQSGALAAYAGWWLGPRNVRAFRTRFINMAWAGDRLAYRGEVTRKYEQDGGRFVDLDLECQRASGDVVARVWMTFEL